MLPINQHKKLEEKLRMIKDPFIDRNFLQQLIKRFAPKYKIYQLSARKLIAPIKKGKLYLNLLSDKVPALLGTTIIAKYSEGKPYVVGGLYLYNQYGYTTQLANRITIYNVYNSSKREIAGFKFMFKKTKKTFFRGLEKSDAQGYGTYYRMTRERALIQLIKETKGNPEFADDIYILIKQGIVDLEKLQTLARKYTNKTIQSLLYDFLLRGKILKK